MSPSPSRNRAVRVSRWNSSSTRPDSSEKTSAFSDRVDGPVRRVGPAELLADRVQRGADDVVDRLGPDDRVDRVDHGLGVGIGLREQGLGLLGDGEPRGRPRGSRVVDDRPWRLSFSSLSPACVRL